MAKGEIITIGSAAAAIGGAYKLGQFLMKAKHLKDVGPSNAVYVRLIGRVRSDLDEVRRLLSVREVHDALESNMDKSKWVYGCMRDVRGALENISPHTERVASDIDDGRRVGVRHRVYWLLSEKEKLENREKELFVAHTSLCEVIGYLAGLEPVKGAHKPEKEEKKEKKEKHVDVDVEVKRDAPHTVTERIVDREVWIERDAPPRRAEERDMHMERNHQGPPRYDERDVHHDERGPRYHDERGPRYHEERGPRYHEERDVHIHRGGDPRYEERDIHIRRDVEPRYDAQYDDRYEHHEQHEHRAPHPEERQPHGRAPFPQPLGRHSETFEDRVPERDTWMQNRPQYAEYGAPQPIGAAQFHRRFHGDPGFGDEAIINPQVVPPNPDYAQREMWIEEKEDYRFDQYGNRLPDRLFQPISRPNRTRL
ncbi:hypothetical protein P153DRAFT_426122 [Dothidotthia symphoricarpi CBS 119687]|uniref:Uncharacterized protein n=1 Tax=Dothidotthia symphoricarpi CBS 119687 TaxID=1392245 RepID=A0A6A6A1S9_9PLEO|nr:uncharacterized protein P153DRAFT_426122 [Dothidotthia symphoricarpi CBS 119687]KAF2125124.1 hypothetical protein P153DRAFT_426122 [Dothidotthia symphoricarpi CBS 119687]